MVLLAPTQTTPPLPPTLVWVPLPSIPTPLLLPPLLSLFQIRPPLYFCCFMTWPPSHQPMRERAFSVAFPRKVPPILEVWDPTHDNRRHNHTSPRPYHRLCTPLYLTPPLLPPLHPPSYYERSKLPYPSSLSISSLASLMKHRHWDIVPSLGAKAATRST